jgi:hypothetical protein
VTWRIFKTDGLLVVGEFGGSRVPMSRPLQQLLDRNRTTLLSSFRRRAASRSGSPAPQIQPRRSAADVQ